MYRKYFRLRGKPPLLDIDDTFYINWFGQSKSANVIEFEGLKRGNLLKWYPSENSASIRDLDNREILRTNSGLFGKRAWAEVGHNQDMIFSQATKIKHSFSYTVPFGYRDLGYSGRAAYSNLNPCDINSELGY